MTARELQQAQNAARDAKAELAKGKKHNSRNFISEANYWLRLYIHNQRTHGHEQHV